MNSWVISGGSGQAKTRRRSSTWPWISIAAPPDSGVEIDARKRPGRIALVRGRVLGLEPLDDVREAIVIQITIESRSDHGRVVGKGDLLIKRGNVSRLHEARGALHICHNCRALAEFPGKRSHYHVRQPITV
jgi:hypothetical protein